MVKEAIKELGLQIAIRKIRPQNYRGQIVVLVDNYCNIKSEEQSEGSDPQRIMEIINRMWCSEGKNRWVAYESTTQLVLSDELKNM